MCWAQTIIFFFTYNIHFAAPWTWPPGTAAPLANNPPPPLHTSQKAPSTKSYLLDDKSCIDNCELFLSVQLWAQLNAEAESDSSTEEDDAFHKDRT